jgi:hypothetical protein
VKIYVAAVEALMKKERGGQNWMKLSLANVRLMYTFGGFFFIISPGFGPNPGYWCRVFLTLRKTLLKTLKTGAHKF